jgi:hypothetical protein
VFDNKVFVSASYRTGSALVEVRPEFTYRVVWTTQDFGLHFNTPIYQNGYLYGFDGRIEPAASLKCVEASSGKVVWRETPEWTETYDGTGGPGHKFWEHTAARYWRRTGSSFAASMRGWSAAEIASRLSDVGIKTDRDGSAHRTAERAVETHTPEGRQRA